MVVCHEALLEIKFCAMKTVVTAYLREWCGKRRLKPLSFIIKFVIMG
jgi:hypothetical protein